MRRIFLIFFVIILASLAFAAVDSNNVQELDARYNYINCRVILVEGQAGILSSFANMTGTDKLTADLTQLKGYADAGDAAGFNTMAQTLNNDFKTVSTGLKAARKVFAKSNVSKADKDALRSKWNSTISAYKSCNVEGRRSIVSIRKQLLQNDIDRWNAVIANMTSRGLDTTQLQLVVSDAQKLLSNLQNASAATSDNTFKNLLNNANDERLHIWARFAIGRIKANIARIQPIIGQTNLSSNLDQIDSLLNSAGAMATPGKKYGSGEFQQTWQDIKDASQQLNTLSKDLRKFVQDARQAGRLGNWTRNLSGRPGNMYGRFRNNTNPRNFTRGPRGNMTNRRLLRGQNQPPQNTQGEQQ